MTTSRSKLSKLMSSSISGGESFHSPKPLPPYFSNVQDMRNEGSRTSQELQGQRNRWTHKSLLLLTEGLLHFRNCLMSDTNALVGRDWAHHSAIKLILTRYYRSQNEKEEMVNITFVSLKDIGVRSTGFTQFPLNLTCKRTPNRFPWNKGTVLQHRTVPPVLHTYPSFCAIAVGMIHLRFVLNVKLFAFFPFFKSLMLFAAYGNTCNSSGLARSHSQFGNLWFTSFLHYASFDILVSSFRRKEVHSYWTTQHPFTPHWGPSWLLP